jgi:hypothetical protein
MRLYNKDTYFDRHSGLVHFNPLPLIPIKVFVDATLPLRILELILDDKDIEVFGQEEIARYPHPDTKVFQVIDASMSKTSLRRDDRFYRILEFIGNKARKDFKDKKILITTYKDEPGTRDNAFKWRSEAEEWLYRNYPDAMDQVTISHMAVGTNEFEDFDVQFLVCGIYMHDRAFHEEVFKLKHIANFWNRRKDRRIIANPRVPSIPSKSPRQSVPVRKVCKVKNYAIEFEFDQFKYWAPEDWWVDLVEEYNIAQTQQSLRLRLYKTDKPRTVFIFGNYFFPTLLITDYCTEDDILIDTKYSDE